MHIPFLYRSNAFITLSVDDMGKVKQSVILFNRVFILILPWVL